MKRLRTCKIGFNHSSYVPPDVLVNLNLSGPEMFNLLPVLYDQQTGGVIMKVLQEIIYGVFFIPDIDGMV